jgi:hypothetical protein
MKRLLFAGAMVALSAIAGAQTAPVPPVAPPRSYAVKGPVERNDPYYWLRDDTRKNPQMLGYLNGENAYADAMLASTKPLQDQLFKEIVGRIKQDDSSVPVRDNGYYYYSRFQAGQSYPIIARKRGSLNARPPACPNNADTHAVPSLVYAPHSFAASRPGIRRWLAQHGDIVVTGLVDRLDECRRRDAFVRLYADALGCEIDLDVLHALDTRDFLGYRVNAVLARHLGHSEIFGHRWASWFCIPPNHTLHAGCQQSAESPKRAAQSR